MLHNEIVSRLAKITDPSEVIYSITMQDILSAIARRMGEDALTLPSEDLELAREEVKEAINHHLVQPQPELDF
jgi:hypothetical protein